MARGYETDFEATACDDVVPADPRVECGVLTVPEDRSEPDGPKVRLPIAIIRTASAERLSDPIVYLSGGPGFPGRSAAEGFLEIDLGGARDVILFDQRGTGAADPSLDCPEQVDAVWATLGAADPPAREARRFRAAMRTCHERLEADGVDLDSYDTTVSAHDVVDLRRALEIDEWNVLGVSYGTTLGLEVLRRDPQGVRAAVLDSVYPTDVPSDATRYAATAERAIGQLFDGCAADPACAAAYPELRSDFDALVQEWNEVPYESDITDPETGEPRHLVITGFDVVAGVFNAMYDADLIPVLPSLIAPLRERSGIAATVVELLATDGVAQLTGAAEVMSSAVECADRQRLAGPPDEEVSEGEPRYSALIVFSAYGRYCDIVDVESAPVRFNRPVRSDRPTLVYGDEYDPVTPPGGSRRTARVLGDATFVLTPGYGHGVALETDCTRGIFDAFLADPGASLDISCAEALPGPAWSV